MELKPEISLAFATKLRAFEKHRKHIERGVIFLVGQPYAAPHARINKPISGVLKTMSPLGISQSRFCGCRRIYAVYGGANQKRAERIWRAGYRVLLSLTRLKDSALRSKTERLLSGMEEPIKVCLVGALVASRYAYRGVHNKPP